MNSMNLAESSSATVPRGAQQRGRSEGALAGFCVGAIFAAMGGLLLIWTSGRPDAFVSELAIPTLVTGIVAGWLRGRVAWAATTNRQRMVVCLQLSLLATALGAYLMGFGFGIDSALQEGRDVPTVLFAAMVTGLALWPFGIVLFGLVALPITLVAAIVWMSIMRRLSGGNER